MTHSVYTLCGFPNLNPVGFCVVCAFCGNYKQRRYKYKSFSPINCNLHFYHSKFRMNHYKDKKSSRYSNVLQYLLLSVKTPLNPI